jgi:integrase
MVVRMGAFSRPRTATLAGVSHDPSHLPVTTLSTVLKTTNYDLYLTSLLEQAERTFHSSRAKSTSRAYKHDWKMFRSWCEDHGFVPLPASSQAVILYAVELAKNQKRRLGTLSRRLAVISQAHEQMHVDSPTKTWEMKKFMAGLRRELGVAPEQKKPLSVPELKEVVAQIPATLIGKRDRAILLLGFAGAFRRSELTSIDVEHCAVTPEGMTVDLKKGKTDQEGEGRLVGIPRGTDEDTCPIRAVEDWRADGEDRQRATVPGDESPWTSSR